MFMSPGNNKPRSPGVKHGSVDNFIERLNKAFGKLLGKKDNTPLPPPKQTSNAIFSIIILSSSLLLWLCTGFYFLDENEYGIILTNGKIADVKHGIKVGVTFPYPFGNVEIIDATLHPVIAISNDKGVDKPFTVLDKNLLPVSINAKFSYKITDPEILYKNRLQEQVSFDDEILWQVMSKIRYAIAMKSLEEIKTTNFTVLSNEISDSLNLALVSYGIKVDKFTIVGIDEANLAVSSESQVVIPLGQIESAGIKESGEMSQGGRIFTREVIRDRSQAGD